MGLRVLSAADLHIFDAESCQIALDCFERSIQKYHPDVIVCLGDLFDTRAFLAQFGPEFHRRSRLLHREWLFVFGNHDGSSTTQGRNEEGWRTFCDVFGPAQYWREIAGHRFVSLGETQP